MPSSDQRRALAVAIQAARAAGKLMRQNLRAAKQVNFSSPHDIKLELDVLCQKLIGKTLASQFPGVALLGEEGITGDPNSGLRWVVDPIDGTVNFAHGIPHACVSIALQERKSKIRNQKSKITKPARPGEDYATLVGVVYDPFCDELWTAICGQPARLNGAIIRVSERRTLREAMISIGFAKSRESLKGALPCFNHMVMRVRKVRNMGSAALALTYVATGRFDAYIESGIRLWDIAAGGLIVECAGGEFWREPIAGKYAYRLVASNGLLRKKLDLGLRFRV